MRMNAPALAGVTGLAVCTALFASTPASAAPAPAPAAAANTAATLNYYAQLNAVAPKDVTGSGGVWISLTGNSAKFTLQVAGLVVGAPHPAQLWVGGKGQCPTTGQAALSDGHETVSLMDEQQVIGTVGASLTTTGDTSPNSALAMPRYPTAGSYTYTRTFDLDPATAAAVKNGNAVLVVRGIDHNSNGRYDGVLGGIPGGTAIPAEATDPALCGSFAAAQMRVSVPAGSADTGGGSAAASLSRTEIGLGIAALVGAIGAAIVALRRRAGEQSEALVVTNGFRRIFP